MGGLLYIQLGLRLLQRCQHLFRLRRGRLRNRCGLLRGLTLHRLILGLRWLNLRHLLRLRLHLLLLCGRCQLTVGLRLRVRVLQWHHLRLLRYFRIGFGLDCLEIVRLGRGWLNLLRLDGKGLGNCLLGFYFIIGLLGTSLNDRLLLIFLLGWQCNVYPWQLGGLFAQIESHAFLGELSCLNCDLWCLLLDYLVYGLRDDPHTQQEGQKQMKHQGGKQASLHERQTAPLFLIQEIFYQPQ